MLKRKLSKEQYDALSEDMKKEYKQTGDDYTLDLEDYEDPAELRRARDREKQAAKEYKEKLEKLEREAEEAKASGARASGDIATLEKSWQDKLKTKEDELKAKIKKREDWARQKLVDEVAQRIATELSDAPKVLLPHVRNRLDIDLTNEDEPQTIVLDSTGKRSALTPAELAAEFQASPDFAAIIRGSKATGAGGGGGQGSGATNKKPNEMNDAERVELYKKDPAKFKRLFGNIEV